MGASERLGAQDRLHTPEKRLVSCPVEKNWADTGCRLMAFRNTAPTIPDRTCTTSSQGGRGGSSACMQTWVARMQQPPITGSSCNYPGITDKSWSRRRHSYGAKKMTRASPDYVEPTTLSFVDVRLLSPTITVPTTTTPTWVCMRQMWSPNCVLRTAERVAARAMEVARPRPVQSDPVMECRRACHT